MANRYGIGAYSNADVVFVPSMWAGSCHGPDGPIIDQHSGRMQKVNFSLGTDTNFGYRQPVRLDPVTFLPDPTNGYWYYQGTGNPTVEQQVVDEQLLIWYANGVRRIMPFYYPQLAQSPSNNGLPVFTVVDQWLKYFLASRYKPLFQFMIAMVSTYASFDVNSGAQPVPFPYTPSPGTWLNWNVAGGYCDYFVSLFQDPNYLKDPQGNPLYGLFDGASIAYDVTRINQLAAKAVTAGFPGIKIADLNNNTSQATLFNGWVATYGPSGAALTGTQNKYLTQIQKDRSNWNVLIPGPKMISITLGNDGRPPRGLATFWPDRGTYSEMESALIQTLALPRISRLQVPGQAAHAYSFGEWGECQDTLPTKEQITRGPNTPSYGVILDACKNVLTLLLPAEWDDHYSAAAIHNDLGPFPAGWTSVISNNPAYQHTELQNSTTVNPRVITVALKSNQITVLGGLGAGLGVTTFSANGGPPTVVNQDDGGVRRYNQVLYVSPVLPTQTGNNVSAARVSGLSALDEYVAHRVR